MKVSTNSLKEGNTIIYQGHLWLITKAPEHVKPGKGPAYVQLEMKNIRNGTKLNQRFSSSDTIERAFLEQKIYKFLYQDKGNLYFMDNKTYEQITFDKNLVDKHQLLFLQEDMLVTIESFENEPINFILPQSVILEIIETDPVIKGATAAPSYKSAILSNGIAVKVPSYLTTGEKIVVKTQDNSFVERAK